MDDIKTLIDDLNLLIRLDSVEREVFARMHSDISIRIFDDGKASDNTQIGKYSDEYKIIRKKKGLQTDKVDLQFSRRMLNDFVLLIGDNQYGHGFNIKENFDKSINVENIFKKDIFDLSDNEFVKLDLYYQKALDKWL